MKTTTMTTSLLVGILMTSNLLAQSRLDDLCAANSNYYAVYADLMHQQLEYNAPADSDAKLKAEIQAISNAWAIAMNNKDINSLMDMYAENAVSMPDNGPSLVGKKAIRKSQEQDFKKIPEGMSYSFTTVEVYGNGNVVTEVGTSILKDAAGKISRTGKYITVYEKQNDQYLCIWEIYNSDEGSDE